MANFMFTTGIENSYPTIALPDGSTRRVDEMEKCGHYKRWQDDFRLVNEMGIEYLRYGPPLYKTHLGPDKYDWSFCDETFNALQELKIRRLPTCVISASPTGSVRFRTPIGPRFSRTMRGPSQRGFPG